MRVIVYGAGALGGVLGGHLALHKHEVLLICRERHATAIRDQQGLRMKSGTGEYFANLTAQTSLDGVELDADTVVLFTPKSNDTEMGVRALAGVLPADAALVSFQNGIANEEAIAAHHRTVLGGVSRMTCSFLQPGHVSFRRPGRLIVGKYPHGASALASRIAGAFEDAGFDAVVSNRIMEDKWLKLVVNLQSAWHAIVDNRDHDTREFVDLKVGVLDEAKRVLKAARIKTRSCDGRDPSIDEMIEQLRKPRAGVSVPSVKVNNSTWQNLYLARKTIENRYFHGPIIERAAEHDVAVPFNTVALESVERCLREGTGPNTLRAEDLLAEVKRRAGE